MKKERYYLLDVLRGLTLISMIVYHGIFDLVELYGVPVDWFWKRPGYVWQQSICWTFILLSGFCCRLGKAPFKRGLFIFGCGLVITAATCMFMPSEKIFFGILTFTGTAMLTVALLSRYRILERLPAWMGLAGSGLFFFLTRNINEGYWGFESLRLGAVPAGLYRGWFTTFLGFPHSGFWSGDYFSFFPWFFLYLCGYFLYGLLMPRESVRQMLGIRCQVLEWPGRNSLLLYMLHQPALMLMCTCIF